MTVAQLTRIFTDINDVNVDFDTWFTPIHKFSYIVLKDNSLLYIGDRDMWYFDTTDELLYVASAILNTNVKELQMPQTGVTHPDNLDRITTIIDFQNINHVVLHYMGEHLGGRR
jgi:hypothetical protein